MKVKKILKTKIAPKKVRRKGIGLNLSLPTERSKRSENLADYTNMIYGAKKIGKTTLSSHFPQAFHLMFETGSKALEIMERMVPTWEHFLGYITLLEGKNHDFKNGIIDTGAIAYDRALEYVCKRKNIKHPSDLNDYGATWREISQEFERAHTRIVSLGMGLIVIVHEKVAEIETRSGKTFNQIVPALSGQADEYYAGTIDNIFYYEYVEDKRFLTIRGDEYIIAGTRCEKNFLTPDGERIYRIPMGDSSEEAYTNLVSAFNNEQEEIFKPTEPRKEVETKGQKQTRLKKLKKLKRR